MQEIMPQRHQKSLVNAGIELLNEEDNTYSSGGHDILKPLQQLRDVGIDTICSWGRPTD